MNRFNHRLVRDLAWVIASPPLVSTKVPIKELSGNFNNTHWWSHTDCLNEFNDCLPTLTELDKNPIPLEKYIAQLKSKKLGLRFESFVAYWLSISPNYELLTQNFQLIEPMKKGNYTLGEVDFIIRDIHTKEVIHLEVAVKFYLGSPPFDNTFRWFGTNTKDQLGKKVDHLINHQTQLSIKYPKHLRNHGYSIDKKECFLKGRLFYPLDNDIPPQGVTENHLRGRWVQSSNAYDNALLIPIEKIDWFAELNNNDLIRRDTHLEKGFRKEKCVKCYVHLIEDTDLTNEVDRLFYLPSSFQFPC